MIWQIKVTNLHCIPIYMYNNGCIVPQIPEILHTVYINPSLLGLYSFELKQVAYIEWESCELIWQIYTVNNSTKCMVVHVLYRSAIPQSDICIYICTVFMSKVKFQSEWKLHIMHQYIFSPSISKKFNWTVCFTCILLSD